jgi:uncharacterized protein (DUF983 family)
MVFPDADYGQAFFSMEFFNWKIESDAKVSSSLWLYFAVMVPLTIIIVLFWLMFTRRTRKRIGSLLGRSTSKIRSKAEDGEKTV